MKILTRAVKHILDTFLQLTSVHLSAFFPKLIVLLAASLLLCSTSWTCSFQFILYIPFQPSMVGDHYQHNIEQYRSDENPERQKCQAWQTGKAPGAQGRM